jgi:hypothetical protein
VEVRFAPAPDRPLVIVATDGDVEVELIVADRADDGRMSFDLPGTRGLDRVWMPEEPASPTAQHLGTVAVRTMSPLALYQVRVASADVFGGFRPKDVVTQAALKARFFPDVDDAALQPTIARAVAS